MLLEFKKLDEITEADLAAMIQQGEEERKTVDYKRELPAQGDPAKKEFLYDVTSFANASGGHIIYGMDEALGKPTAIRAIINVNPDAEIRRMHQMLESGVQPRVPGVEIKALPISSGGTVLVMRIPKSWAIPHMVTAQDSRRFYSRNSAGKYLLDVPELRSLFAMSGTVAQRLREFRAERLGRIVAGETPVPSVPTAKAVLHVIPLSAFDPGAQANLRLINNSALPFLFGPGHTSGSHYNFDGRLMSREESTGGSTLGSAWVQVFRTGIIEAAGYSGLSGGIIESGYLAEHLFNAVSGYFNALQTMAIQPPVFVALTLLNVSGYTLPVDRNRRTYLPMRDSNPVPIDRDVLAIPEVMAETFDADAVQLVRPILDVLWNACGWERCMDYDENGAWKG